MKDNTTWPPAPSQSSVVPPTKPKYQEWSYLTRYMAGDLALGLLAGVIIHFLAWTAFGVGAEIIAPIHPTPLPLYYGSWIFAVVVSMALGIILFRRYPALVSGFVISTVPVAAINLLMMWFGAGLAGGAAS